MVFHFELVSQKQDKPGGKETIIVMLERPLFILSRPIMLFGIDFVWTVVGQKLADIWHNFYQLLDFKWEPEIEVCIFQNSFSGS